MDSVIASLQQRFEVLNSYNEIFGFLGNILTSSQLSETVLLNHCLKLEKALTQTYENKEVMLMYLGKTYLWKLRALGKF